MCVSVVDQSADKLSLLVCDAAQEGRASGAEGGVERDPRSSFKPSGRQPGAFVRVSVLVGV